MAKVDKVKDIEQTEEVVVTTAKIVPTIERNAVPAEVVPAFEVKPGNYHLVRLDAAGNEIPGSDFQIGTYNAEKSYIPYADKYKVKKSPLK